MMKVLIVSVNRNKSPLPVMPLGACLAAESVSADGHKTKLLDFMFEDRPLETLGRALDAFRPDVVGISARNIDNNDMRNPIFFAEELLPVVKLIREKTSASVVLGGSAVSIMPEEFLRYTGASYAVSGEADPAFPRLLRTISRGERPEGITGVSWIQDGDFNTGHDLKKNISSPPLIPDYSRWINVQKYRSRLVAAPIKTKTGCDFRCVYCTYNLVDGKRSRFFSPKETAQAVGRLVKMGLKDIEFVDNVFNVPYAHAMSICEEIINLKIKARLQTLEVSPAGLDNALLHSMDRAGFKGIGITVESASDRTLRGFEKGFTALEVHRAAHAIRRHSIPCMWFFMLGGPGENAQSVEETLRFACEEIRPGDVAYFTIGVRVYPGTKLEAIAREQGVLRMGPSEMLKPVFYVSPEVDAAWMEERVRSVARRQPNFMIAGEAGPPWGPAVFRLGFALGLKPPLWRYAPLVKRGMGFFSRRAAA